MRSWMIAFSLGIVLAGFIPQLSPAQPIPFYFLLLITPLLSLRFTHLRLAGAFMLGLFWFLQWALNGLDALLPFELENKEIWVIGEVVSLPQQAERSQRFELLISQICSVSVIEQCDFGEIPRENSKVLLNVYQNAYRGQESENQALAIKPGQQWRLKVKLKRPHGFSNPGGFDYEAWLFQHRISATGYVRDDLNNALLKENSAIFSFQRLRFEFRERLKHLLAEQENKKLIKNSVLIKALSIGDRYNITHTEWNLFTATGTNHLIVISGLHVGLVTLLIYRLSSFLVSFLSSLTMNFPSRRFGAVFAALAAFFYAGLAGFSLPAQRAFIMVAVYMAGTFLCRNTSTFNSYCLALGLSLMIDPLAPQGSGFWLSFGAVGLLILLSRQQQVSESLSSIELPVPSLNAKTWLLIKTQAFLCLGLLPLMLLFFQQTSLLAPLVNLIAIPFISLLVVPLCLVGLATIWWLPALAKLCFSLADWLLVLFKQGLTLILDVSMDPLIQLPALSWLGLSSIIAGILILLSVPAGRPFYRGIKACSLLLFLPLLLPRQASLAKGEFSLNVLDVGQGLATVINTQNHYLLYDTGPTYSPRFEAGNGVVIPYLRSQNIPRLDTVIISHGDNDHAGGLAAIADYYPQAQYWGGDISIFPQALASQHCQQGQRWLWDEVSFEILHPADLTQNKYSRNDVSCVLKISTGQYSVLLTGDIEKGVERLLLNTQKSALKADILIAPHHGSQTSSTKAFIAAVAPEYVVFSSGYLNRFKHPHPNVLQRYDDAGTIMLNTAVSGELSFKLSASEGIASPLKWREVRKRYWSAL